MGKYDQDSKELLNHIGGKENIQAVTHCITRMRFVLSDPSKADIEAIEAMKVVKGSFTQSGQFQVIIGNNVADFYQDFVKVAGVEGVSKDVVKEAAKSNQTLIQRIVSVLAEIFAPLIPAIITGGLILGFRNCIDSMYLFEHGTKTLCQISQFWAGMDSFLWLIGEAIFHMLPVGICWSVTKKMGTTQMLGIVLGLTLVSGQLLNAYSVATTAAADIPKGFWICKSEYDRISGTGTSCNLSSICTCISGEIFSKDHTTGCINDRCAILQFSVICHDRTFCSWTDRMEDWISNLSRCLRRNHRII